LVFGGLTAVGETALDAVEVSAETFRLAIGLVLALEGAHRLLAPAGRLDASLPAPVDPLHAAAWLFLTPGLVLLSLGAGAEIGTGAALGTLAAALAATTLIELVSAGPWTGPLLLVSCRLFGALELAVATILAVRGIQDV
jgi:hypothetical protein